MNTIFLRTSTREEMESAFLAAGVTFPDGLPPEFNWPGLGDVSVVGVIYNDDAVVGRQPHGDIDDILVVVSPATVKPGFHVNVLLTPGVGLPAPLAALEIPRPNHPCRIFGGA